MRCRVLGAFRGGPRGCTPHPMVSSRASVLGHKPSANWPPPLLWRDGRQSPSRHRSDGGIYRLTTGAAIRFRKRLLRMRERRLRPVPSRWRYPVHAPPLVAVPCREPPSRTIRASGPAGSGSTFHPAPRGVHLVSLASAPAPPIGRSVSLFADAVALAQVPPPANPALRHGERTPAAPQGPYRSTPRCR